MMVFRYLFGQKAEEEKGQKQHGFNYEIYPLNLYSFLAQFDLGRSEVGLVSLSPIDIN